MSLREYAERIDEDVKKLAAQSHYEHHLVPGSNFPRDPLDFKIVTTVPANEIPAR